MVITTIVLSLGFLPICLGEWRVFKTLGLLQVCYKFALLADIFLAPAIMVELQREERYDKDTIWFKLVNQVKFFLLPPK